MGYGLDKGWGSPSRPSTWKISAPTGGYKEGCTPLLAFWATQLLLHSLQNLLATTGQYLKPHPETRVKTSFFLTSCGKNQMPSCSTSSISRQHSEEETRSLRTSESKPIYLKTKSTWISKAFVFHRSLAGTGMRNDLLQRQNFFKTFSFCLIEKQSWGGRNFLGV